MKVFVMADEVSEASRDKLTEMSEGYIHSFEEVMKYFE
jgi:hypothetical protein